MMGSQDKHERRNSFELESSATASSFSREDKLVAMSKSFSTGNLTSTLSELQLLQPAPQSSDAATCYFHKDTKEHRIRIELEGDGPLGLVFVHRRADGEIVVASIEAGTACSEFPELETELLLREVDGSDVPVRAGFPSAMRAVAASWERDSAVTLVFARPSVQAPLPRTASGRPSLEGLVRIKDDGVGSLEAMSPIHEAHRKGATPQLGSSSQPLPPPELNLGGLEPTAPKRRVKSKRERRLDEVRNFLRGLKVEQFMDAFVDFGVSSMEDLKFIEPTDLPGFGLTPLQQRRVATALAQLDSSGAAASTDPTAHTIERSPSQVFETDAIDPPALSLGHGSQNDVNVFISPCLGQADRVKEEARIRQEAAQQPGVARLHTHQGAWAQGVDV